jgi:hypothetical protein
MTPYFDDSGDEIVYLGIYKARGEAIRKSLMFKFGMKQYAS